MNVRSVAMQLFYALNDAERHNLVIGVYPHDKIKNAARTQKVDYVNLACELQSFATTRQRLAAMNQIQLSKPD